MLYGLRDTRDETAFSDERDWVLLIPVADLHVEADGDGHRRHIMRSK